MVELEDFKDWYEENKDKTPSHDPSLDPLGEYPMANNCLTLILGATGSGKSYVMKDIMERVPYNIIFFISPTSSFDQTHGERPLKCNYILHYDDAETGVEKVFEYLMRRLKVNEASDYYFDLLNRKANGGIVSQYDIAKAYEDIMDLRAGIPFSNGDQPDFFDENNNVMVILDDCGYQSNQMKNKDTPLSKLVMIRRHLGVSIMVALQSYVQISKDIRRQCSDIIMTKRTPNEDIKALYHQLTNLPFRDLISQPRFFSALVEGLMMDEKYGNVQFLHEGFMHNFKDVTKEKCIQIIREYEALRREMRKKIDQ